MPKPDRVAAALVKAALDLHGRQLWTEVASDALFLLRIPGQDHPFVGSILGQAGEQFGMQLVRGEGALAAMLRLFETEGSAKVFEEVTLYGVTVQPLREIEPELRVLVEAAGLQLRREALAPLALCKPPGGLGRPANRSEWRLLTRCVKAVLTTHDEGTFKPESIDGRRRHILEITVEEVREPIPDERVRTAVVRWPAGTSFSPGASPTASEPGEPEGTPWDEGGLPQTLDEWKLADRVVTARLVKAVTAGRLLNKAMLARYFGSFPRAKRALEQLPGLQPMAGFLEWAFADWWPGRDGQTLLEQRLADPKTPPVERAIWQGRAEARLSIYRVLATRPGEGFDVEDVLSGERATVTERLMSGSIEEGQYLPLRLMRIESWDFCATAGPPFSALDIGAALDVLRRQGADLTPGCLRRLPHLVGRLWDLAIERGAGPPPIGNADGEPLEFHAATFRVLNPAACARDLDELADLDRDKGNTAWDWVRPDTSDPQGKRLSVLGRIQLLDDRLLLEVNSAGRLARARKWIEKLPGVRFETATARSLGAERPLDDRLKAASPAESLTAERRSECERVVMDLFREWLDRPLGALGKVSPRAACRTATGRQQVAVMIRTMRDVVVAGGLVPAPREWLMKELGIAGDGQAGAKQR